MKITKYFRIIKQYIRPNGQRLGYVGGVHGSQNLGDEALYKAIKILFPSFTFIDLPRKRKLAKLFSKFFKFATGTLAGGTLINQKEEWLDLVSIYSPNIDRFFIFGTGVASPKFWPDKREEWINLLEKMPFVGVRGPLSKQLLEESGLKGVEVVGDPVLALALNNNENIKKVKDRVLGINIGWDSLSHWGNRDEIYREIVKIARLATDNGWIVRWFVVCPSDLPIATKLAEESGTNEKIVSEYHSAENYMKEVGCCSVFIGSRLHAVVLATCAYVPSLMVEYRPKCRDFMCSIGQDEYNIRADRLKAEKAWKSLCEMESECEDLSNVLYNNIQIIKSTQKKKANKLQSHLIANK